MCVSGVYGLWVYMWNVTTQLRFLSIHPSVHPSVHSFIDSFIQVYTPFTWSCESDCACGVYLCVCLHVRGVFVIN